MLWDPHTGKDKDVTQAGAKTQLVVIISIDCYIATCHTLFQNKGGAGA